MEKKQRTVARDRSLRGGGPSKLGTFACGGLATLAIVASLSWTGGDAGGEGPERISASLGAGIGSLLASPAFAAQVQADLGDGDYLFLPNRRTIWVVNRKHGRFANYHFRNDQEGTILRSRVISLDQRDFPPGDTLYVLSDRNLTEVLWVCNRRTGDVQLWQPRADGNVVLQGSIATSPDLIPSESSRE